MEIQTLSIVCGTGACNASCPYCISKMTPGAEGAAKEPQVNWRNFEIACRYAKDSRVSTAMLTGKGEPTLYPQQISAFLDHLQPFGFPFVELQTNGVAIARAPDQFSALLERWYDSGLSTVAVSIVHYNPDKNREVFTRGEKKYIDLPNLIDTLHQKKLSVRLTCTMLRGFIDGVDEIKELADFARATGTEQLTIRPVNKPDNSRDPDTRKWVQEHLIPDQRQAEIEAFLEAEAKTLMDLPHGARVYDLDGQNLSLANSLTLQPTSGAIRQLIFFPDGHLRYDWQYQGAIIL